MDRPLNIDYGDLPGHAANLLPEDGIHTFSTDTDPRTNHYRMRFKVCAQRTLQEVSYHLYETDADVTIERITRLRDARENPGFRTRPRIMSEFLTLQSRLATERMLGLLVVSSLEASQLLHFTRRLNR